VTSGPDFKVTTFFEV